MNLCGDINEPPLSEPPRERLRAYGAQVLSDAELLAITLRLGTPGLNVGHLARRLLREHGGWPGLQRLSFDELTREHGLGFAKAAQLKAALEIGRRLLVQPPHQRPQIAGAADVAGLLMVEMAHLEQEHLRLVLLTTRHAVLRTETVYIGSISSATVRIGEVFKAALKHNAAALIAAHNHPSGDATPSPEDVVITRQLVEAGKLLGVELLDHLIIGQGCWISLRERRLGFAP